MKTSISLDEETLKGIDNYRRTQDKIPTISKAIIDLIHKGLEGNTEIPKDSLTLEDLIIHIREPSEGHGGSSIINLPYHKIHETNLKNEDKIQVWIKQSID